MGWFQKLIYGHDLEVEQRRSDELDEALRRENLRDLEAGVYDRKTYDIAEAQRLESRIEDVEAEVDFAFDQEFDSRVKGVRDTFGNVAVLPLRLLPPIVWVIAGLALIWYAGGAVWLKGAIPRLTK